MYNFFHHYYRDVPIQKHYRTMHHLWYDYEVRYKIMSTQYL
jgi:hypothetical protein